MKRYFKPVPSPVQPPRIPPSQPPAQKRGTAVAGSPYTTVTSDENPAPDGLLVVYTKGRGPSLERAQQAKTPPADYANAVVTSAPDSTLHDSFQDTLPDCIPLSSDNEGDHGDGDTSNTEYSDDDIKITTEGPKEPPLCPEQQRVVDIAATGANVFYTGSAGCGKTRVLQEMKARLKALGRKVQVLAPTGKAALAIGGLTIYSFLGITPDIANKGLALLLRTVDRSDVIQKRLNATDTIIIDEISMVENLDMERINCVMQRARDNDAPFGGVQVILTGDFCQLPPVLPFKTCAYCGVGFAKMERGRLYHCRTCRRQYRRSDKWAFRSTVWAQCNFEHINLTTIHRQQDQQLISILQKCRMGRAFSRQEVDLLLNHHSNTENAVRLFSTRDEVRELNKQQLKALPSPSYEFNCVDHFEGSDELHAQYAAAASRNHRLAHKLELKQGAQVLLQVNLNLSLGLYNGSQGVIVGLEPYDESKLPRRSRNRGDGLIGEHAGLKQRQIRRFARRQIEDLQGRPHTGWPIVRFVNGLEITIYPECVVAEIGDASLGYAITARTQIPLEAAWALTFHKAQGMTLERVIVDLSKAFEEGQVYVALSRATALEGLKVMGRRSSLEGSWQGNREVKDWLREMFRI